MNSARWFFYGVMFLWGMMNLEPVLAQGGSLTGPLTLSEITENDHVFEIYIDRYQPDDEAIAYLKAYQDTAEVVIFYGSWCRESKKYLPGLIKTLQSAANERIQVHIIGVDAQKKVPAEFLNMHQIEYIPTVVVLKGNEELGRIVEKPLERIETDLVEILKKAPLKK